VVYALTGWGQEADRLKSQEAGCNGHLVKPVNLRDLERVLADLAAGSGPERPL
jgi:CheY-like chemotaxis protein